MSMIVAKSAEFCYPILDLTVKILPILKALFSTNFWRERFLCRKTELGEILIPDFIFLSVNPHFH